jgi:hypothetical protein
VRCLFLMARDLLQSRFTPFKLGNLAHGVVLVGASIIPLDASMFEFSL